MGKFVFRGRVRWSVFCLVAGVVFEAQAVAAPCRVMLVPGAFGVGTSSLFLNTADYFREFRTFFEAKGCAVKKAEFPPDATIEERALILKDQLARFVGRQHTAVALIAHSQGALDARFALKTLGLQNVGTLISIGAPHSGTPVAQWVVEHRERGSLFYWLLRVFGYDLRALSFVGEMTPRFLQRHMPSFDRVASVRYASAQGVCQTKCHWSLRLLAYWVGDAGSGMGRVGVGRGDGIVGRDSQRWGDDLGEYDLDHISEVGVDPAKVLERAKFLQRAWEYISRS